MANARDTLRSGHVTMRRLAAGHEAHVLNWRPGSETNSVVALVAHALDAERFLVATIAGITVDRDREAPFGLLVSGGDELVALVDQTETEVDGYLDRLDGERLRASIERPNGTHEGFWWLLHVIAHSREHIGQAELTLQLCEQSG